MNAPAVDRGALTFRREAIAGALAAAVVALVIAVVIVTGGPGAGGGAPAAGAGTTTAAEPTIGTEIPDDDPVTSAPVMPEPTGPTSDANALPAPLPAVGLDEPAVGGDGVRAEVVSLEAIQGSATGVGNVAGPALRATVRVSNGSPEPLALDFVSVNMTHGTEQTPASPLDDPSTSRFSGTLEPGAAAEGVYVFSIAEQERDAVTVVVGYRAASPYLVFTGAAS